MSDSSVLEIIYLSTCIGFQITCFNFQQISNVLIGLLVKGTDQAGTFMSLKCVVYYANYRSWHQSSKIQVVSQ